ncbi:hypothetical protein ERO13_D10G015900v2 [Gossypium hirsutum]|uniref:Cysteine-rich receptor-like protein kinase 15 n=2 Tax=Gossypium TaxID=3633 RepID=A0A1U8M9K4_GOSHI|nr:cysteine-rich receptor-like protein kinase 15 [Gossypium hirsutum]KAG4124042.1 hypothetical protein ERO13_D10G015900v2 [Gossypium hirsutum]TYI59190.1 hypothetical protein E1A91_D10G017800v1 [Gossypium mustelinum]
MPSITKRRQISTNFINLVLLLTVLSLLSPATEAQQHRFGIPSCPNTTTFTINSTYQANRDTLLSSLSSNVTRGVFFYNTTAGKSPDMVYGLFLCRGDISTSTCQACVTYAATHISRRCPLDKTAVVWYEECFLRYSNRNIFSVVTETPTIYFLSGRSSVVTISEEDRFEQFVLKVINETIAMAESRPAGVSKYVTRVENISSFQTLYIRVDCTPDLLGADCGRCLRRARAYIPAGRQGGRAFNPSCSVRYEFNPFFNLTAVAALPAKGGEKHIKLNRIRILITSLSVIFGVAVVFISGFFIWRRRNSQDKENIHEVQLLDLENEHSKETSSGENWERSQEFPSIQLDILHAATNHFSDENKLGEGGFGPVYKGTLANGKEIAVKRLSRTSGQGLVEFKNEVLLIARLQHKNLVRLLGCCLEKNEKLLVYEFMPNRSLDVFLFDSNLATQLDWQKRFNIIKGIVRGIMYLHEDSRLRIIHRDLKASNILLDHKMNPKISDFGMARIFCEDINQANTNRVVGTYGYMAPEYAMEGLFSIKSDVFSFGVLLLEIISGKKNNGFHLAKRGESLLTFAWKLWSKGEGMELIDQLLVPSCVAFEVLKCIHIGLLCVQEDPADRPTMSSVIFMLASDGSIKLPRPTEPAFSVGRVVTKSIEPISSEEVFSVNEITVSNFLPR